MDEKLDRIQSFFERALDCDHNKKVHVDKATCDQTNDFHKHGIGNRKLLKEIPEADGIDVRQEMFKFFDRFYSANAMTLCVYGKESVDELYGMVRGRFNQIKNENIVIKEYDKDPFLDEHLKKRIEIAADTSHKQLIIHFSTLDHCNLDYIPLIGNYLVAHFNHQADGSLEYELKSKGLINRLESHVKFIEFELTNRGFNEINEVVKTVFQYINLLKKDLVQKWRVDEYNQVNEINFNYRSKSDPLDYCSSRTLIKLTKVSIQEILKGYLKPYEYKPEMLNAYLSFYDPKHMRMTLIAKEFKGKTTREEEHYSIGYNYEDISDEQIEQWSNVGLNENLYLPEPNRFIPANFELVERDEQPNKQPVVVNRNELLSIWYLQDCAFKEPKSCVGIHIKNPDFLHNKVQLLLMQLYCRLVMDTLNGHLWSAFSLSFSCELNCSFDGLEIVVYGFSDKFSIVLTKVIEELIAFDFSRLNEVKEIYRNSFHYNSYGEQSFDSVIEHDCYNLMHDDTFLFGNYFAAFEVISRDLTPIELEKIVKSFYSNASLEVLVYGNVTRKDVDFVEQLVNDTLVGKFNGSNYEFSPTEFLVLGHRPSRHFKLKDESYYIYEENSCYEKNAILNYYQFGPQSASENVKVDLLQAILSPQFYFELNIKRQLKCSVRIQIDRYLGIQGLYFYLESNHEPQHLDDFIERYLDSTGSYLFNLKPNKFVSLKENLIGLRSKKALNLSEKFNELWRPIKDGSYAFDENLRKLKLLNEITKQDIVDTFYEYFYQNRRKISIRLRKKDETELTKSDETKIRSDQIRKNKENEEIPPNATVIKKDLVKFLHSLDTF